MRNPLPPREEEELSSVFLKHPSLAFLFGKSFSRGFLTLGFIWGLPRWTNFQRGGNCGACGDRGGETTSQDQKSQLLPDSAARKAGAEKKGGEREVCPISSGCQKHNAPPPRFRLALTPSSSFLVVVVGATRPEGSRRRGRSTSTSSPHRNCFFFSALVPVFSFPASSWESQSRTNKMGGQCGGEGDMEEGRGTS